MTAVCVGRGPSLTAADVEWCRDKASVLVINENWVLAPWADALYAADQTWWDAHAGVPDFPGAKYGCLNGWSLPSTKWGCTFLANLGTLGWSDDPTAVYTGHHSGYQAIQVAAHRGADRILLLGYDLLTASDRRQRSFSRWLDTYGILAAGARQRGIAIVNCSRESALTVFPRVDLREALQ